MIDRRYPVGLDLRDRLVVLIGGGSVVQRRVPRLLETGARLRVISPEVTASVEGLASAGELEWLPRHYRDGDLDGAWYALACTDQPDVNAEVVAEADRSRVFCVRSDAGELGTAVTPAVGEHEGLTVAVLSGGEPRRSASVRTALIEALHSGVIDDNTEPAAPGVALVGGGPGDPGLITVRGRRLLSRADVVVADRLAPQLLLEELASHVEVIDASKIPYGRAMQQEQINAALIDAAKAGKFVVRLKGGDPFVFGRGFEEVIACAEAGVPVTVVPGVSSAFAAPAAADVPVSHRGVAHEIVVVSGHVAPDDKTSLVDWSALARLRGTLVLMMGVARVSAFAKVLIEGGRPADTPVAVIQEGTTSGQRSLRSTLTKVADAMADEGIRPPAVIVVGPVAGLASGSTLRRLSRESGISPA
jgi:uroporphyrin-III C-methyltransferase / precorrin-2 dehydrogenase / sirohydrochlorin ferrochelatase